MTTFEIPDVADEALGEDWEEHENKENPIVQYHNGMTFADPSQQQAFQPAFMAIQQLAMGLDPMQKMQL